MSTYKIDISKYLLNDKFGCVEKELSVKDKWDNDFLYNYGIYSVLNSPTLNLDEKVKNLRQIVDSENDSVLKNILEIMLFNIKFEPLIKEEYDYCLLSYNSDYECFYVTFYTNLNTKKERHYISRVTVEKIIVNEILSNLNN